MFVDLPSVGAKYSAGDSFGSVESVKAASDVYTPVSGEIVEVNAVRALLICMNVVELCIFLGIGVQPWQGQRVTS